MGIALSVPPPKPEQAAEPVADCEESRAEVVERLFREHNEALIRFLRGRVGSHNEALEVAQEAYVRLLSLDQPGAVSYLRAFLFKTAANIAIDRRAVEAMLAGLPVVASDVGGLRDVVANGVTGRLVPPGEPGALASALDLLLADPQAGQRMGAAARQRARRFEAAAVVPRVADVLAEAVTARVKAGAR